LGKSQACRFEIGRKPLAVRGREQPSQPTKGLAGGMQSPQRPMGKKSKPEDHFKFGKLLGSLS
jgi:hypothetical protein